MKSTLQELTQKHKELLEEVSELESLIALKLDSEIADDDKYGFISRLEKFDDFNGVSIINLSDLPIDFYACPFQLYKLIFTLNAGESIKVDSCRGLRALRARLHDLKFEAGTLYWKYSDTYPTNKVCKLKHK